MKNLSLPQKNVIWLVLLLLSLKISAQQFNFQYYSLAEGLAQSQVYALFQDSKGYIWMGTQGGGINRFDGTELKLYTPKDGLPSSYINTFFEDGDGQLWVGTSKGIAFQNGKYFKVIPLPENMSKPVNCFCEDQKGGFWVGTKGGLFHKKGDEIEEVKSFPGGNVWDCLSISKEENWFGSSAGLWIKKKNKWAPHPAIEIENSIVQSIKRAPDSTIWVSVFGKALFHITTDSVGAYGLNEGLTSLFTYDIHFDEKGNLWLATQNAGVQVWHPSKGSQFILDEKVGFSNNHVRTILKDDWNNLWFGTSGGGVSKYLGQQFRHFGQQSLLRGQAVYAMNRDTSGKWWLSVGRNGLASLTDTSFQLEGGPELRVKTRAIFKDDEHRLWLGTDGKGVFIQGDSTWTQLKADDGIEGNWVKSIAQDTQGVMWIATADAGISRVMPDSNYARFLIKNFNVSDGLKVYRVNDLLIDKEGRVWFASNKGGGFIKNNKVFNIPDIDDRIRCLIQDPDGAIWAGTAGEGILRIQLNRDTFDVRRLKALTSNNIYLLVFDEEGKLWAGSNLGVDKIRLNEELEVLELEHYGRAEGFKGIETCQDAYWKDEEGHLWFGTMRGLTEYSPQQMELRNTPPKLHFSDISLFYESLKRSDYDTLITNDFSPLKSLEFSHRDNHLQFEFKGIHQSNPESVRYQWRLLGLEENWSPIAQRTQVTYANLDPGSYQFEAKALDVKHQLSSNPIQFAFTIKTPYWQKPWFKAASIVAAILLVGAFIGWRISIIKRKAKRRNQQLSMENQLLQLEQKALQLQMNPHFIFNALNSVQGFIIKRDEVNARKLLQQFAQLMRAILKHSRKSQVSLADEVELLHNYLSLEKVSRGNSFDFSIEMDEFIPVESVKIPPMMIQPFVENAIVHGVAPLKEKGQITLEFEEVDHHIICKVKDNGIGYFKSLEKAQRQYHESTAIKVISERLELLDEKRNGAAGPVIEEWLKENGEVGGTIVRLRLPVG